MTTSDPSVIANQNKRAVRELYEGVLSEGRFDALGALVGDEYVGPGGTRGPGAFAAAVGELRAAFPDLRYTVEDVVAEGDRVAARWTWRGTHEGPFKTYAPTHARVTSKGTVIHRMKDGKVVETWLETDRLGFLEQLGAVPPGLAGGPPKRP